MRIIARAGLLPSVGEVLDQIEAWVGAHVSEHVAFIFSPVARWYFLFALFVLACGVILRFFGWISAVRVAVSVLVALGGAFVAGGHVMYRVMEAKAKAERARLDELENELEKVKKQRPSGGGGSWWS